VAYRPTNILLGHLQDSNRDDLPIVYGLYLAWVVADWFSNAYGEIAANSHRHAGCDHPADFRLHAID
jgi:hypothetical protein